METNEKVQVELTQQEFEELQALRLEQAKRAEADRRNKEREAYKRRSEDLVEELMPELLDLNRRMREVKGRVYKAFDELIGSKEKLFKVKSGQRSHNFINASGNYRIVLGYHKRDQWDDTAEAGVELVRAYISSLGSTEEARELSEMLLDLLSKDANGNLKADKVLLLDRYASKNKNGELMEAVGIIKDAYKPEKSKQFIRAEVKDPTGMWRNVPLNVTEVGLATYLEPMKAETEAGEEEQEDEPTEEE